MIPVLPTFPNKEAQDYIETLPKRVSSTKLMLFDREYDSKHKRWIWKFKTEGSINWMELWAGADLRISCFFKRDEIRMGSDSQKKRFSLNHYLTFTSDLVDGTSLKEAYYAKPLGNYRTFFSILERHLNNDLSTVISGEKWIDVPYDWDGYR